MIKRFLSLLFPLFLFLTLAACATTPKTGLSLAEREGGQHNNFGVVAEEKGDFTLAATEFRLAHHLFASIEHETGIATSLINLSRVERHAGRPQKAWIEVNQATLALQTDSPLWSEANFEAALVLRALQRPEEALGQAREALRSAPVLILGRQRNLVARLILESGDHDAARSQAELALQENRNAKNRREEANSLRLLGEIFRASNEMNVALENYQLALVMDKESGRSRQIGDDLLALGDLSLHCANNAAALDYWRRAWEVRAHAGDRAGASIAVDRASLWLQEQGRTSEARTLQQLLNLDFFEEESPPSDSTPSSEE